MISALNVDGPVTVHIMVGLLVVHFTIDYQYCPRGGSGLGSGRLRKGLEKPAALGNLLVRMA